MAVSRIEIVEALDAYKQQYETLRQQIEQLERTYQQQRELGMNTLNQVYGAVQALESLLMAEDNKELGAEPAEKPAPKNPKAK